MPDGHLIPKRRCHGMTLRGSTLARTRCPWASLPSEIRLIIQETIAQQKYPGWASFAAVSKEWQLVIARENLCQLKLEASCLDDFGRVIVRQRHLIHYIQLEVELLRYLCQYCRRNRLLHANAREDSLLGYAIGKLFRILNSWESAPQGYISNGSLMLELNAYSPSDIEHWF